ncbi:MAG TPA: hypothetical protein VMD52_01825 [Patescibacteria group bacterium]|nr:hypothetical protein [Patescibacteria group bacterium]
MSGILAACIVATLATVIYAGSFILRPAGPQFSSRLPKLVFHYRFMLWVWIFCMPLMFPCAAALSRAGYYYLETDGSLSRWICLIYGLLLLTGYFFFYVVVYYIVDRSVSSRIMRAIENSPQKKLTFQELKTAYRIDKKYQDTLQSMIQGGFVRMEEGRYMCTLKGALLAHFAGFMKSVLKLGPGG